MKKSQIIYLLSVFIIILSIFAAGMGLFSGKSGDPFSFTTLRGQTVQIYGQGIYYFDSVFMGAGNRGVDVTILCLALPALIFSTWRFRKNGMKDYLLHCGVLAYFLYAYVSMTFGVAYNKLFLIYTMIFSASLFAFILTFSTIDLRELQAAISNAVPRKSLAVFMYVAGIATLFIWGEPLVSAILQNRPPVLLDSYTTMVTYGLDLAIITPATIISAVLVGKGESLGYLIAMPLLFIVILMPPQIAAQTYFQVSAGINLTTGQIIGPIAGFAVLGLIGLWFFIAVLKNVEVSDKSG